MKKLFKILFVFIVLMYSMNSYGDTEVYGNNATITGNQLINGNLTLTSPLSQSSGGTGSTTHTERWCGTAGGTANAITLTPTPAITSYVAGQEFIFVASATNTTAATLAISGLSALSLTMGSAVLPVGGIISGNTYVALVESGSSIRVSPYDAASVNGDTINGAYTFIGTTDMDLPTYGSEFLTGTGWTSTGWTGSWAGGWVHTVGNTSVLSYPTAAVNATRYQIAYTVTGRTAGSFTVAFGGQSAATLSATGAFGPTTTSTANLTITPTTDFDGTIVISIKTITAFSTPIATYKSSDGTARIEIREQANNNTFIGLNAGRYNTSGTGNTFIGSSAGQSNTTGSIVTAIGTLAFSNLTTGIDGTAVGWGAAAANTTGTGITAIGRSALGANTTGSGSTALGTYAGIASTGAYNTYIGYVAGYSQTTGTDGVYVGVNAGRYHADGTTALTTSSNSVYIGYNTRGFNNSDNNSIVIGANAIGAGANTVVIGDANITQTYLKGNLSLGVTPPTASLHIKAGTATAGTAPLKFTTGTNLTTPEAGVMEYDATNLFFTNTLLQRKPMNNTYILASLIGANMNTTADQAITMPAGKWIVRKIVVTNASVSLTTAVGGFYTAAAKGGVAIVAATQIYSALTTNTKFTDLTLTATMATDILTNTTTYFSLTTAQGVAATADIFIIGDRLDY